MKTTTFALLLAVLLSGCARAGIPTPTATPILPTAEPVQDPKVLAADLDALMQANHQAGVFDGAILVARNGQMILSQGYGFADRFNKIPNTPQTKFPIGSLTKQFTAMAILMLQARGKLTVEDKLCSYIPNCPEILQPIRLHHLLTHTAGLPDATRWEQPGDKMLSKYATLVFPAGEKWIYGDVAFDFLGRTIETVSGQTYEDFVRQNIFEPLQMSDTGYNHQQPDLAKGYAGAQGDRAQSSPADYFAAGAIYSTVEDLYRYDQALYTDKLLPQSVLKVMFTAQVQVPDGLPLPHPQGWSYGYGWFIGPELPRPLHYHGGMPPGYRSAFWRYPDDRITIIQLCNHEAVMLVPTEEAIANQLLGN